MAWDEAPGFYGTSLAEDYELSEQIGVTVDTPLGAAGGVLSFAVFYADDTALSNSIGNKRGRNSTAAGGVGNTGELNNVALQYAQEFGDTTAWVGARYLSAGEGDTADETGIVAGASHNFGDGYSMIGELAHFNNMLALGVDRALSESLEINFGVARFDVGGEKSTAVGLAAVVSF